MVFVPENDLETTLVRAVKEPAVRPEFYRLLLTSDLFVIGQIAGRQTSDEKITTIQEGENLQLASVQRDGKNLLPVFSSLLRLRSFAREGQNYLGFNGRTLFETTRGASFVLNPGAEYGKDLLPGEIAQLLDPTANAPRTVTVEKPTQVLIGQPAIYPTELVSALKTAFGSRNDVLTAYLVQIAYPGEQSHPLIGVETIGDWKSIATEIGRIIAIVMPNQIIDLIPIDRTKPEGLTPNLLQVAPFYSQQLPNT